MRKADRETESRKLIGEKLREARMADNSPMTEADAEYYRILAEARATHASKENTRKSAKKHALTSAAAILLILAVAGGSFILGMQSDVRASADPDDERKVVQQGDNIVIDSGDGESYENVGVMSKTYYSLDDAPENIKNIIIHLNGFEVQRVKEMKTDLGSLICVKYRRAKDEEIEIRQRYYETDTNNVIINKIDQYNYNGYIIYEKDDNFGRSFEIYREPNKYNIFISFEIEDIKIEDIIDALNN